MSTSGSEPSIIVGASREPGLQIFVINLARAIERRQRLLARLGALGLEATWLQAVDGARDIGTAERARVDDRLRRRHSPYPLSDNEIACWLSHLAALQAVADSGAPMACILEDDAEPLAGFAATLAALETGTIAFDLIDLHRTFATNQRFVFERTLPDAPALGRVDPFQALMTGYVVTAEGARCILAQSQRFVWPIDKQVKRWWALGLDFHGLERPVVRDDDHGHSFIDEDRHQDRPSERARYPGSTRPWWRLLHAWNRRSERRARRLASTRIGRSLTSPDRRP